MKFFSIRNLFKVGVRGAMVTGSMISILMLVFFANSLLKLENTEYVFFIFRLIVVAAAMLVINVLMHQKSNGELTEEHKKKINKLYIYLALFYVTNELFIMWRGL